MAGVLPGHRSRGVGQALKLAQRRWAAANGFDRLGWTYDPLRELNAHFNLNILGAALRAYLPDYYPPLDDALSTGRPTDRVIVFWSLNSVPKAAPATADREIVIPSAAEWDSASPTRLLAETLRVRDAFLKAEAEGFTVQGFARSPRPRYLLKASE
jgi:predicted GNAT superfamily acetyltransferase